MKRNSMRMLSLLLTLVMLLGAVPFASAAPTATIIADPGATVWEGTDVDLILDVADGTASDIVWSTKEINTDMITVSPTTTTEYSVNFTVGGTAGTASKKITVWQKAGEDFAVADATVNTNKEYTLDVTGAGDSTIEWSVDSSKASVSSAGVFKATEKGTYTVTAIAENDLSNATDNETATATIKVEDAVYELEFKDQTFGLRDSSPKMAYTVLFGGSTYTGTKSNVKFEIAGNIATINSSTGALTLKSSGTTTVTLSMTVEGVELKETAILTVTPSNILMKMDQDGDQIDDDSIDLDFSVVGPDSNDKVTWDFTVSAMNIKSSDDKKDPYFVWHDADTETTANQYKRRQYEEKSTGPEIDNVELEARKGYGIAVIDVTADWNDNPGSPISGTFYISFYDEDEDITVTVKDGVDEFDWDDKEVFSAVKVGSKSYTATELKSATLADILALDAAEYIDFDEGRNADDNEDVGTIEASSKVDDYDPDEVNTYEIDDLKYLTFEADDEGVYEIEYKQYGTTAGYDDLTVTEGVLKIVVGDASAAKEGDINYNVKNKGEVTLDEDDFEDFWDDYVDDENLTGDDADFGYVIFDGYKATSINGALYAEDGDKSMTASLKLHFDYDDDEDDGSKDYDLTEVIYKAHASKTNYVDEIDFTCYSDNGDESVEGTLTFTVGEGEKETTPSNMNFTDVKTSDWFYDAVSYVYSEGIMAGTSTTKFEPNSKLSRAMVVTMLYRLEGEPTASGSTFTDVKDTTSWYYKAVCWAAKNGIVNGVTETTFAPNNNITREQLAAILYRYAGYKSKDTSATKTLTGYPDASSVSTYATTAMRWAITQGIISGDNAGKLNPQGTATRAEAATMFQRFLAK